MNTPAGYSRPSRATNYRGTMMRSRLEATVAAALDAVGIPWEYEPHALADGENQWLPDFRLGTANGARVYVEVRPTLELLRRDLPRYTGIAAVCDPDAIVIGLGHVDGDPLHAVTAEGLARRLVEPNRPVTVTMDLLPVPAPLRRRASERARLDKLTRDLSVFRTPNGRGFVRYRGQIARPLTGEDYSTEPDVAKHIAAEYADTYGRNPSAEKLLEHMAALTAATTVIEDVCHGITQLDRDRWLLDLGADYQQGRVVTITSTGWRLSERSPRPLYRHGITALPRPVAGGHVDELFDLINVHEDDFDVFVDHLAHQLLPGRPKPTVGKEGSPMWSSRGVTASPLDDITALVRSDKYHLFEDKRRVIGGNYVDVEIDHVVRFVAPAGNREADAARASATIKAASGRLLGALLNRAVTILAGPRQLPATTSTPAPDAIQLVLDTFPGAQVIS